MLFFSSSKFAYCKGGVSVRKRTAFVMVEFSCDELSLKKTDASVGAEQKNQQKVHDVAEKNKQSTSA